MKAIDIQKEFTAEERMTRVGGERLRALILSASQVELCFSGKPIASVSFLDEGLAKLALEGWVLSDFQVKLQIKEMHPRDKKILDDLIQERLKRKREP